MNAEKILLYLMQVLILAAAFTYLAAVTFLVMPESGQDHSKTIVGFLLGTVVGTIITFNWGSSKSSADKSEAAQKRLDVAMPASEKKEG
jgi:uncharacterized integral membrane protein